MWNVECVLSSKLNDIMDWAQQTINENGVRKNTTEQYFGKVVCLFWNVFGEIKCISFKV